MSQASLSPPPVRFPSIRRLVQVVATDAHEGPVDRPAEDSLYLTSVPRRGGDHPVVAVRRLALDGRRFPLETDSAGRIYASFSGGVQVLAPSGALLGAIALPGAVTFCFGTAELDVLFITTDDAIWAAEPAA